VTEPKCRGFGSTVLQANIVSQLRGTVALHWNPEGLVCEVSIPTNDLVISPVVPIIRDAFVPLEESDRPNIQGSRILFLKDEPLVAIQSEETLRSAGCHVLSPASRVHETLKLLEVNRPDAALIDVNVAGELSYPVADALITQGVPLAFVTGYAVSSSFPNRFQNCPVVAKPFTALDLIIAIDRMRSEKHARG
jgi:CheY-like chemotaxis protein